MISTAKLLSHLGCLAYLASPILALALGPRAQPYQTRIVDTATTFAQENNGVWQLIDATGDGIPDLGYIKTSSTGTNTVEVHIASQSSGFKNRIFESGTTFALETDGTWQLIPSRSSNLPDLAFIKTSNTPSGRVEVHIASAATAYRTRILETATVFGNENFGTWSLYDYDDDGILDLVYIKTSNTGSGTVELHVASGSSNYQSFILHTATQFAPETNGFWYLAPYSGPRRADLVYIKDVNANSGRVEVYVVSQGSGYQTRVLGVSSLFGEEANGVWSLVDYNGDGVLDLGYVKYQNTGTGTVEVHVADG